MQKFTWNANGSPNFGVPVGRNIAVVEPAGTPHFVFSLQDQPDDLLGNALD